MLVKKISRIFLIKKRTIPGKNDTINKSIQTIKRLIEQKIQLTINICILT